MIRILVSATLLAAAALLASPAFAQDHAWAPRAAADDRYSNDGDRNDGDRDYSSYDHRDGDRHDYERHDGDRSDGYRGDRSGVVRCESTENRRAWCRISGTRNVRILSQISNSACLQNRSWGYNSRGIWVDRGCRADFRVYR